MSRYNRSLHWSGAAMTAMAVVAIMAPSPARAQEGLPIGLVQIRGRRITNEEVVRLALAGVGIKEGQVYRAEMIAQARQAVIERGLYSDAYIKTEVTGDRRVTVSVEVFENPVIKEVRISGNRSISSEKIIPFLESRPETVINTNTLREDAQRIQRIYRQAGYEAFLNEVIEVFDPKTGILTFPVTETVVDSIEIQGLNKTRLNVVTREMRTKPGDALNINRLRRDQSRILATGLFADVGGVGGVQTVPTEEGRVKVIIPVQEQRTGQVQVGFGYSIRQRLTGTLEVAETNFRGRGQGVSASWTIGGAAARNQFELGFSEPWLDKNNTSLSVNLYSRFNFRFNRLLSSAATDGTNNDLYSEERRGGSATLSRPVSDTSRIFTSFRTESVRANNLQPNYSGLSDNQINSIRGALVQNGNVGSVTLRFLTNTRDNDLDPSTGFWVAPSAEFGTSRFNSLKPRINPASSIAVTPGANTAYLSQVLNPNEQRVLLDKRSQSGLFNKFNLDTRRYINLGTPRQGNLRDPRRVIATRLLLGTSTGNIGFSEQYFMGGVDNLRGFQDDRFWGNNLFLLTTELRIPFDKRGDLSYVFFADVGDAWGATDLNRENIPGFGQHGAFSPHLGYGIGIRLKTPVGPVRLDLARGEQTRTHFAIGQSF